MDELRKILTALRLPSWWVYKGVNHSLDDNLDITVYGAVYADRVSGSLIRVAYLVSSARVVVVEKMANGKYASRINERSEELAKIQGGIDARFRAPT